MTVAMRLAESYLEGNIVPPHLTASNMNEDGTIVNVDSNHSSRVALRLATFSKQSFKKL
jgi:hypothetical protein